MTPAEAIAAGASPDAVVPAPNERPTRLTLSIDTPSPSQFLAAHRELVNVAREAGWAEVGFDYSGSIRMVTLTPTGRVLGAGARGGSRPTVPEAAVREVLRLQTESEEHVGARRIQARLNELAASGAKKWQPPRSKRWSLSTVQAMLRSDYYERLKAGGTNS